MIERVVMRPQRAERRDGHQDVPAIVEQRGRMPKRPRRILEVLEDIEHEDERVAAPGAERLVERPDLNAIAPRAPGGDDVRIGFDPLDLAEPAQKGEQHAVAAADVQHARVAPRSEQPRHFAADAGVSGAPPPVAGREVTVASGVRRIHRGPRLPGRR
jgi:hypothetical protein